MGRRLRLSRAARFAADPALALDAGPTLNGHGGWPALRWLAPWLTLELELTGQSDPRHGMLVNIVDVDRLLRSSAVPAVASAVAAKSTIESALLAAWDAWSSVAEALPHARAERLTLRASPSLWCSATPGPSGVDPMPVLRVTEQFEFSASHRLHSPALSDAENLAVFGKCNNPAGHGHNYVLDVTVEGQPGPDGAVISLPELERVVKAQVLDAFDHRHLTSEVQPFCEGTNSTVENIAQAIFQRLAGTLPRGRLAKVRVYETPKTWAECEED